MKIKFLGTGAADWNIKDRRDGEFFRRLSSTLINDDLLIDPGPHIFDFCERENCPTLFENVTDIIVTHSHADHFCADTVKELFNEKARRIWCNETVAEKLCGIAECNAVLAGDGFCAGKYSVTALKANHTPVMAGENTLLYNISDGEKSIFYGLDSVYYGVGDTVKTNVPVGYTAGETEVQVTMYSGGELLNCFELTEENCLAWVSAEEQ